MAHRDKSLWPHITNKPLSMDIETEPGVIVIDHKMPTGEQMRAEMRRAIDAGERLGASHNWSDPKTNTCTVSAAELGTAMHQEIERQRAMWGTADEIEEPLITGHYHIGDSHIGMGREEINRQLLAYAHLTDLPAMIVSGGDILHERGIPGPDVIMVVDGDTYHLDYKTSEERILQFMHGLDLVLPRDRCAEQALQYLDKAIDNVAEPKVVKPKAGRSKDWEQRNRKRRR